MAIRTNVPVNVPAVEEPEAPVEKVSAADPAASIKAENLPQVNLHQEVQAAPPFAALKDAFDQLVYGNTFLRMTGGNGAVIDQEKRNFGSYIYIQVLSFNDRWMVTPQLSNSATEAEKRKAKFACRASYDGKTIQDRDNGEDIPIREYTENHPDFDDWKTTKYMDVYGIIFGSEKNSNIVGDLGIVQVSVSQTAIRNFDAFFKQSPLWVMRGMLPASHQNCMKIEAEGKTNDSGNYTIFKPGLVPAEVLLRYTPVYMM